MRRHPQSIDAKAHVYRDEPVTSCERKILAQILKPGMAALDVGCGAVGRSARILREFGCEVYTIDINYASVLEFSTRGDAKDISTLVANAAELPFPVWQL